MSGRYCSLALLLAATIASAPALSAQAMMVSVQAASDVSINTDANSSFWRGAKPVSVDSDYHGKPDPKYKTTVLTRWTKKNLYFLFICPYEQLNLKPNPSTSTETYELWNWDVAEVFIGSDFKDIRRYKEFEISPQGEWIDLDIDLHKPHHEDGWTWNSGFQVSARINPAAHTWYGAMKIPYAAIDTRPAVAGNVLRINLFRSQGPASNRHAIAWQPTMANTFHVPERFGLLKLVNKK